MLCPTNPRSGTTTRRIIHLGSRPEEHQLKAAGLRRLMSARKVTPAIQAGFGGKADADAHNLRPGCGNRGKAAWQAWRDWPDHFHFRQPSVINGEDS